MARRNVRSAVTTLAILGLNAAGPSAAYSFRKLSEGEIRPKVAGMDITDDWADLLNRAGTYVSGSMGKERTGSWPPHKEGHGLNRGSK